MTRAEAAARLREYTRTPTGALRSPVTHAEAQALARQIIDSPAPPSREEALGLARAFAHLELAPPRREVATINARLADTAAKVARPLAGVALRAVTPRDAHVQLCAKADELVKAGVSRTDAMVRAIEMNPDLARAATSQRRAGR
ncbi:MAG: hypothetical protein IT371_09980 [Deltaproteobacteria bacterium]|nr:hypothetical protein [Deltaproteobacteria bacterium]